MIDVLLSFQARRLQQRHLRIAQQGPSVELIERGVALVVEGEGVLTNCLVAKLYRCLRTYDEQLEVGEEDRDEAAKGGI